jgi:hypothetical protein
MATELARMAEMLIRRSSARKMGTVTELSQSVAAKVKKSAVPGSGRSRGESSGHKVWSRGSRETKGVKGPHTVKSEKRTMGSQVSHSKPRGVKVNRTRVVCGELENERR